MASIAASSQNTIDTMEPEHWSTMELPDNGERAGYDTKTIPMTKHQSFTSIGNLIDAGLWESTPGGFAIKNRKDTETIYILSGTATITDEDDGTKHELCTGSWHTFPTGWSGRWDITSTLRKLYILLNTTTTKTYDVSSIDLTELKKKVATAKQAYFDDDGNTENLHEIWQDLKKQLQNSNVSGQGETKTTAKSNITAGVLQKKSKTTNTDALPELWTQLQLHVTGTPEIQVVETRHKSFDNQSNLVGCGLHESSVAGFGKRQYSGGYEVSTRSNTETFFMLSGIATITDEDGTTHELSKGSWYTLPTGWSGRWDIEGKMRKLYILTK